MRKGTSYYSAVHQPHKLLQIRYVCLSVFLLHLQRDAHPVHNSYLLSFKCRFLHMPMLYVMLFNSVACQDLAFSDPRTTRTLRASPLLAFLFTVIHRIFK